MKPKTVKETLEQWGLERGIAVNADARCRQLETLVGKLVETGSAVKQCLEIMDNGEKRITTGCVFLRFADALAEAKKLEIEP